MADPKPPVTRESLRALVAQTWGEGFIASGEKLSDRLLEVFWPHVERMQDAEARLAEARQAIATYFKVNGPQADPADCLEGVRQILNRR